MTDIHSDSHDRRGCATDQSCLIHRLTLINVTRSTAGIFIYENCYRSLARRDEWPAFTFFIIISIARWFVLCRKRSNVSLATTHRSLGPVEIRQKLRKLMNTPLRSQLITKHYNLLETQKDERRMNQHSINSEKRIELYDKQRIIMW